MREKDADTGAFVSAARAALRVCRAAGVPLVINDRVDVALAVGADGVHVGQVRAVRGRAGVGGWGVVGRYARAASVCGGQSP